MKAAGSGLPLFLCVWSKQRFHALTDQLDQGGFHECVIIRDIQDFDLQLSE